ncbi:MAG: sodium:solute symporter [Pseudonocardia sp.]|jgi:SSS family solute:Na+ symporter|uniref:sodium:solute symporter family protein n=1 Tax=Pseudonocardia sp. TaxID=60912 RepID=UPI002627C4E2|nr:sodium:solute symporter family protein [Pseudonocardia sp.]MCU1626636.1 sodium:solute symporter [Pseudonocardia sp.]
MGSLWIVGLVLVLYMGVLGLISWWARRSSNSAEGFATGGRAFPAVLVGFLLASEFLGSTASVGTAQSAHEHGISAAWNVVSLALGFVLFSVLLARRFRELGENTISGALARTYGERVRLATSSIMICALLIVAVSIYASGGAILSGLLGIGTAPAIVVTGVLAVAWVSIGGMRSVVYTNVLHASVKLIGVVLLAVVALRAAGGPGRLQAELPPRMLAWDGIGWAQIGAWLIAGVGAIFATQYVVQAVTTTANGRSARQSGLWSAAVLIPFGLCSAVIGLCSALVHPGIRSIQALPAFVLELNPWAAGLVVCGLSGAMFGTIAALTLGASTLLLKDFHRPWRDRRGHGAEPGDDLRFLRLATVVTGLLPIVLALFASDVLTVSFLAKSLRAALAVLVLLMFYGPRFGTRAGAFWSIIAALVATVGWFLAGDPFGVDNAYVAVAMPLLVMTATHVWSRRPGRIPTVGTGVADAPPSPDHTTRPREEPAR